MARWNDAVRRPLIVAAHGYGGQVDSDRIQRLALRGAHAIAMDARGFGRSAAGVSLSEHGYLLTGYENPRRSILRGAVADYLVSHRVAIELVGEVGKTTFSGFSFAGGLATMAQAVSGAAHLLAVGVPTFGWTERRIELCRSGSGFELARFMDRHPTERDRAMNTMRYFDIVHHAPQINARSIVGIGLRDDIVPAETVYAMVNHLGLPPTLLEYPCSHSSEPEERLWNDFEDYWVGQASSSS